MVHANCVKIDLHIHQIVAVESDAAEEAESVADVEYDVDAAVAAAAAVVVAAADDGDGEQGLQVPWGGDHGYSAQAWTAQPACLSPRQ